MMFELRNKKVNKTKIMFLVALTVISLCAVSTKPVNSQNSGGIYILSDGSVITSTNITVPIQHDGNIYTFTDNIDNYYLIVQRNNIIVDGAGYSLTAQGEMGIDLSSRSNVTIKNLQIGYSVYGIFLYGAYQNTISGNTLTNNDYGVYLSEASQNTIIGNDVTNNAIGFNIMSSSNNILRENEINDNYNFAIYLYGTEPSHFDNDIDDSNTVNDKEVYYLIGESNLVINSVTFPDVGYLALVNCNNITVHNLELTGNGQGILLAYTTNSTIYNNRISDNYSGIALFASSSNYIATNNITDNYRGIQFSNSSNFNGIAYNVITNGTDGIFLFNSYQNTFTLNNVTNNGIGIGLKEASFNMIRANYFIDNDRQVYDVSTEDSSVNASMNSWGVGYPTGGNYWSDYTGIDVKSGKNQNQTGSDGIGDTPYVINQNNQDNFPLMPYGSSIPITIASPENKTYTVNSVSLSFTVSEATLWTKYSLDEKANVTITEDITLSDLSNGEHSITIYAQDTDGQIRASETIYFTIAEGDGTPQSEFSAIILIAAIILLVAIIGVILFYFLKAEKK
jgi:parallel beta-helix repeat protein